MMLVFGKNGQVALELAGIYPTATFAGSAELDLEQVHLIRPYMEKISPTIVINAAAYTAVDLAEKERDKAFAINAKAVEEMAKYCGEKDIPLIHISTDYVFDGSKMSAYLEDDAVCPISAYGESKLAGEQAAKLARRHVILRTAWVYSPYGKNFVKTMLRLADERDELRIVGDQMGCPTSAGGIASAIEQIIKAGVDKYEIYNYSGSPKCSWFEFACEIMRQREELTGKKSPKMVEITTADFPTPAKRPANSVLDCEKIKIDYAVNSEDWQRELNLVLGRLISNAT